LVNFGIVVGVHVIANLVHLSDVTWALCAVMTQVHSSVMIWTFTSVMTLRVRRCDVNVVCVCDVSALEELL
jgi:hypothetical protein